MSKRTLIVIVVIGLLIIIAGAIFLLRSGEESPQGEAQLQDLVTVSRPSELDGWQLIENTRFHYAFEVPPNWEVQLIGDDIKATFKSDDFRTAVLTNGYSNPENIALKEWIGSSKPSDTSEITKGGIKGLRYLGQELVEGYENNEIKLEVVNESYVLGNIFQVGNQVVDIQCTVSGPNYQTMVPTCEKIIKSLQFIQ